ncbi:hypothetical protein [Nocardia miyunensis]|uniref:hypothetical protein n=1 Tax=Nocardia miyunensis TaxID=282684 RepID=UPI000836C806|nr:hypothetical protein [Nocardia miyunensis]
MTRFLAVLSGLLLITAVGIVMPWLAIAAGVLVVAGWWSRVCAVGAVLVALGALGWADSGALAAAATGLVATTYLLNTATVSAPVGVVPTTLPSVAGAVCFAAVAVIATEIPARLEWVPLAAPVLAVLVFALVIRGVAARTDE